MGRARSRSLSRERRSSSPRDARAYSRHGSSYEGSHHRYESYRHRSSASNRTPPVLLSHPYRRDERRIPPMSSVWPGARRSRSRSPGRRRSPSRESYRSSMRPEARRRSPGQPRSPSNSFRSPMRGISPTGVAKAMNSNVQTNLTEEMDPPLETEEAIISYFSSKVATSLLELRKKKERSADVSLETLEKKLADAVAEKVAKCRPALEDRIADSGSAGTSLQARIRTNERDPAAGPSGSRNAAHGLMQRVGVGLTDRIAEPGVQDPSSKRKRRRPKTKKHRGGRKIREKKMRAAGLLGNDEDSDSASDYSD
ncbi:hypothetical protein DXG01_004581 [Tephrocybe rancida]|nr:hypothetical protein DXG01_004581 [Tephrocybe rancida]